MYVASGEDTKQMSPEPELRSYLSLAELEGTLVLADLKELSHPSLIWLQGE